MGTLQNITVAGLVADLGLTGHKGIAAARNSGDHTKLDVVVTQPAWVLLGGGTMFTTDLVDTTVQAPTTDGSYALYVDALPQVTAVVPSWTIAAAAPGVNAIAIAAVVVADGVISAATVRDEGLRSLPVQASALPALAGVPALHGPYVVDYTDIPHDGDTKTLWTPLVGDVLLRVFPDFRTVVQWDHGQLWLAQGVPDNTTNFLAGGQPGYIANADNASNLDTERALIAGGAMIDGTDLGAPYMCRNTDPITVLFRNTAPFADGVDPTAGHVELYALIARAVAP